MGIQNLQIKTVTCNGPECDKTATYDVREEKQAIDQPENSWMKSLRIVSTFDQRAFLYCSDICEAKGVATGQHNLPEPKKLIDGVATPAQIAQAAAAAKQAEEATQALKSGRGGPVLVR